MTDVTKVDDDRLNVKMSSQFKDKLISFKCPWVTKHCMWDKVKHDKRKCMCVVERGNRRRRSVLTMVNHMLMLELA